MIERGIQANPPQIKKMAISRAEFFEALPTPLEFFHNDTDAVLLPTPEECEMFAARKNAIRAELEQTQALAGSRGLEVQNLQHQLEQRELLRLELERRIEGLEKHLADQRANFLDRIKEINASNEEILEARLRDAREVDALISEEKVIAPASGDAWAEVSQKLQKLNVEKELLEQRLRGAQETTNLVQRRNQQLRETIEVLEREAARSAETQVIQNPRQEELGKYNTKLRRQVKVLENEKAELDKAVQEWKGRYDEVTQKLRDQTRTDQPAPSTEGKATTVEEATELRSARAKAEKLRVQNDEMQLKLAKANTTVERLSQLVQRKETMLTGLQAELDRIKQRDQKNPRPPSRKRTS
jgi:DNA repair exonuclease SbcCD ATPase subunit